MKLKIKAGIFLSGFILLSLTSLFAKTNWAQKRSEHFIVYFPDSAREFGIKVSSKAEDCYRLIAKDLGYVRYGNFWKWGNRVKIYLYPDHQAYIKASHQQDWSHGMADYKKKQIISYIDNLKFLNSLLVHEIAHLIFRDFVGFKSDVPLWLDEGVAQWEEKDNRSLRKSLVMQLARRKLLLSMDDMMKLDIRQVKAADKITILGTYGNNTQKLKLELSGNQLVKIYYLQAFSLVGFLMERFGADDFIVFSRQLRDGKSVAEALEFAYPMHLRNIKALEEEWKKYILN